MLENRKVTQKKIIFFKGNRSPGKKRRMFVRKTMRMFVRVELTEMKYTIQCSSINMHIHYLSHCFLFPHSLLFVNNKNELLNIKHTHHLSNICCTNKKCCSEYFLFCFSGTHVNCKQSVSLSNTDKGKKSVVTDMKSKRVFLYQKQDLMDFVLML